MKCIHPECERDAICRECCDLHYRRLIKNGSIFNFGSRVVDTGSNETRFHKKYKKDPDTGCWLWIGGTRANGKGVLYGRFSSSDGGTGAHRYSYLIHKGEIPTGAYILHACDTPLCVNPDHLFHGSHADNMRDMVSKGRSHTGHGERANSSKLTNSQAAKIRASTMAQSEIAKFYGVSQTTISRIRRGETYDIKTVSA